MRQNFNEAKERAEQDGSEWKFGAITKDLCSVPLDGRMLYTPDGVLQYNSLMDSFGCASRSPVAIYKWKFNYWYQHDMHPALKAWLEKEHSINGKKYSYIIDGKVVFDETFIEILSGTTPEGNSLKAPVDACRKFGLIPECLPIEGMTWDEYMDPKRIVKDHLDLGKEFLRRFALGYEQVKVSDFMRIIEIDLLDVAGHGWPQPVNGVYPRTELPFNHAFVKATPEIHAFDSYEPFIKPLAKDFKFFEWGYSLSVTSQNPYPDEQLALLEVLMKHGLLKFFAEAWKRLIETPVIPTPPPVIEEPKGLTKGEILYSVAKSWIGRDASPLNKAPNELACAESVNELYKICFGEYINKINILSTYWMYQSLKDTTRFEVVLKAQKGDILIYPTGYSYASSPIKNGHVFIVGENDELMSNNSLTGKWETKYTIQTAHDYWGIKGGFPRICFRPL